MYTLFEIRDISVISNIFFTLLGQLDFPEDNYILDLLLLKQTFVSCKLFQLVSNYIKFIFFKVSLSCANSLEDLRQLHCINSNLDFTQN